MKRTEIVYVNIDELKLNSRNPRLNDKAVDSVAQSIEKYGFKNPLIINGDKVVFCGNTRLKAARKLGLKQAPCIIADDLSEQEIREYAIVDNKTNEIAEWDEKLLLEELNELSLDDFDFDWDIPTIEQEIIEDDPPEVNNEITPLTQLGDIWALGRHRLMCGDSTSKECVEKLMNGVNADLLLTDPPYNVAYEGKTEEALTIKNDKLPDDKFKEFLSQAFATAVSALKPGASFYIWFASREHCNFEEALKENGLEVRQELIWKKNTMVLGRQDYQWKHEPCLYGWKEGACHNWYSDRCQTTILEFDKPSRNGEHPTMKPVELFAYQIKNSTKKEDVILDLFGGSGTTIIASEQLNRMCYCMEFDPKYCDVIVKRWEQFTGSKAVKINEKEM